MLQRKSPKVFGNNFTQERHITENNLYLRTVSFVQICIEFLLYKNCDYLCYHVPFSFNIRDTGMCFQKIFLII